MDPLWSFFFPLPYLHTDGLSLCSLCYRKCYSIVLLKSAALLCLIWQSATGPHIWWLFWWMDGGRNKKFYFYLKCISDVWILLLPLLSLLFRPWPLLSFFFFTPTPPRWSILQSCTCSFWSSQDPPYLKPFPFLCTVPSCSLPYLLFLALSKTGPLLCGLGLEVPSGIEPQEAFVGCPSPHLSFLSIWSGPRDPWGAFHFSFKAFFQYYFSLFFLTHRDTLPFSSSNALNQRILKFRGTSHLILPVRN